MIINFKYGVSVELQGSNITVLSGSDVDVEFNNRIEDEVFVFNAINNRLDGVLG